MDFDEHAAVAAARKEGAAEEFARIKTILTCAAAKGREHLARSLALDTSMSAEEAMKVLGSMPAQIGNG